MILGGDFSVDVSKDIHEIISFGREYKEKQAGIKDWTATLDGAPDFASESGQRDLLEAFESGEEVTAIFYLNAGTFLNGTALVESLTISHAADGTAEVSASFAGSYAYYFNWKYDRVGHLFQDRYKSEPIEGEAYYLSVLRYIHQNPQKAGIAKTETYKWSSYLEFIGDHKMVNTEFALDMLGGKEKFVQFMNEDEKTVFWIF